MVVKRDKIVKFCEDYLKVKDFKDHCINGLQIEGKEEIKQIVTGVSFSEKLIREAIKKKADMLIVHHGIFDSTIGNNPQITNNLKNRFKLVLGKDINLCGFHLPLDAHPVIGNNISLLKTFGLKKVEPINTKQYGNIGFIGEFNKPIDFSKFVSLVNIKLDTSSYVISAGPEKIKKVGIVSGGAASNFKDALALGADTYLCGDIHEFLYQEIKESKVNFINAGHYNTEKMGVQNLGNLIFKKFNVKVDFIDVPCDI
jgi:dinuclear metal center YbgI/SA1388 family protein